MPWKPGSVGVPGKSVCKERESTGCAGRKPDNVVPTGRADRCDGKGGDDGQGERISTRQGTRSAGPHQRGATCRNRVTGAGGSPGVGGGLGMTNRFSSRSRPASPAEIPGGFSSSLLPPSFPRGRSATLFFAARCPAG